ncbi:CsxC family protein [Brassicibacter mesophilus]|uniref:CsxC family protein n=1 Tax=Brassicibacter mesophilus TaxID=745119 RepID=UPI003D2044C9
MSYSNQYGVKIAYGKPQAVVDSKCVKSVCTDVTGGTLETCVNEKVDISGLSSGVVAKIPVVLAELTLQINVDSIIDLPEYAYEIKDIKKHLKVTQCLLIQNTNMLFIKGFVRKNIQYATRSCSNEKGFCGDIKHCTIDVPFRCTTPITFNGIAPAPIVNRTSSEFEYLREQNVFGPEFAEKDKLLSGDLSEFNQVSTEYFNELPFCELISSKIVEFDEFLNPTRPKGVTVPFEEKQFRKIEEKMVIFLTLKLLQKRQVAVPPAAVSPIVDC